MDQMVAMGDLLFLRGGQPRAISSRRRPRAQMSLGQEYSWLRTRSGLMQAAVPMKVRVSAWVRPSSLLMPKSDILTSPAAFRRIFSGLRSLWIWCLSECRKSRPARRLLLRCAITTSGTWSASLRTGRSRLRREPISMYSMTRLTVPSLKQAPQNSMRLGCLAVASVRRSFSRFSRLALSQMQMALTATRVCLRKRPRKTWPETPCPILRPISMSARSMSAESRSPVEMRVTPVLVTSRSARRNFTPSGPLVSSLHFDRHLPQFCKILQAQFKLHYMLLLLIPALQAGCPRDRNDLPLLEAEPALIRNVTNGELRILRQNATNFIYVAKLKGSPYQMGLAMGQLMKDELHDQVKGFYTYVEQFLEQAYHIPASLRKLGGAVALQGWKAAFMLNVAVTFRYTKPYIYEEIRGLSAGSGVPLRQLLHLNIFPELIKAHCSVVGVWGPASRNGRTLHLRALDWDNKFPINRYPLITVYHPTLGHRHANVGYLGMVGVLTGISDVVSVGEKVWLPPKASVPSTRFGQPWMFVLRDVLLQADNLTRAMNILSKADRTCTIHLGVATNIEHSFKMALYSQKEMVFYDDQNYTHYGLNHPRMAGIAYFDKHVQPSADSCLGEYLQSAEGNWTLEEMWRTLGPSHRTGDTQLAAFELESLTGLIAYSEAGTGKDAFLRAPFRVDFRKLFQNF